MRRALCLGLAAIASCTAAKSKSPAVRPGSGAPDGEIAGRAGEAVAVAARESRARPRILLTPDRAAALERAANANAPGWRVTKRRCDDLVEGKPIAAGYEAWDWANALASLVTCWTATHEARYRTAAAVYLGALVDDRRQVGDHEGGDRVVEHDDGYPIRTFGVFAALGYDWLHDAPEMTQALRARIASRLVTWTRWYRERGYLRDQPIANHFMGYFTAEAMAGIALEGDDPRGAELHRHARDVLFRRLIVPAFRDKLAGGDWPEGWQYGDHVVVSLALYADAERAFSGANAFEELPWLREVVHHHAHAILPDGVRAYDGGDWSDKPARMPAHALWALAGLLPSGVPERGESLFLARALRERGTFDGEAAWLAAYADDPNARTIDPRAGVASASFAGTGLTLARSDWSNAAVFVSLQSGPTLAADHQHSDQGHVGVARGGDWLLVDSGDYGAASTMNHNTILVDDGGDGLTYPPNQGRWGTASMTSRYVDAGDHVAVRGEFGDAYRPYPESGRAATVERAVRDLVYVRPALVAIYDRVRVTRDRYGVSWIAHGARTPALTTTGFSVTNGESRADVAVLVPDHARPSVVREPSPSGNGPWFNNEPFDRSFERITVASPRGTRDRTFLVFVYVGSHNGPAPDIARLSNASGVDAGVVRDGSKRPRVVAFARDGVSGALGFEAPDGSAVLVANLAPGAWYRVTATERGGHCAVVVERSADARAGRLATASGTIAYALARCNVVDE